MNSIAFYSFSWFWEPLKQVPSVNKPIQTIDIIIFIDFLDSDSYSGSFPVLITRQSKPSISFHFCLLSWFWELPKQLLGVNKQTQTIDFIIWLNFLDSESYSSSFPVLIPPLQTIDFIAFYLFVILRAAQAASLS